MKNKLQQKMKPKQKSNEYLHKIQRQQRGRRCTSGERRTGAGTGREKSRAAGMPRRSGGDEDEHRLRRRSGGDKGFQPGGRAFCRDKEPDAGKPRRSGGDEEE